MRFEPVKANVTAA